MAKFSEQINAYGACTLALYDVYMTSDICDSNCDLRCVQLTQTKTPVYTTGNEKYYCYCILLEA